MSVPQPQRRRPLRELLAACLRLIGAAVRAGLEASLVLVVLVTLVFLAVRLLPGDPTSLVLGDDAPETARIALRARLGFDRSLAEQWVRQLAGLATFDVGTSLRRPGVPAFDEVRRAFWPTAQLSLLAVGLGTVLGVTAALASVGPWLNAGREVVHRGVLLVAAAPLLAVAPVITFLLCVRLPLLPLPGDPDSGVLGLAFAAFLLALPLGAQVARIGRAALLEVARAPFLRTATAKGATRERVWLAHALPVTVGPLSVVVATQLGALLGGAVVLEKLFERPGLGTLLLEAWASRDLPVLEACVATAGALFVLVQATSAALVAGLDPRRGGG